MARSGFPSMTALLGLLAVAGYQNRDRISEMLRNAQGGAGGGVGGFGNQMSGQMGQQTGSQSGGFGGTGQMGGAGRPGGLGGLLGTLFGGRTERDAGTLVGGGLGELDQHLRRQGRGETLDSWVGTGPNQRMEPHDLEAALGPEVIEDLQEATGLSRQEIVERLSRELPDAVDRYTPEGRLPDRSTFS